MGNPERHVAESTSTLPEADGLSEAESARLMSKIDWHVLPMLFIIYVAAFLDRANIANALTLGLPEDLGLTGQQPNTALAVFFVPYIIFEIPSNILMKIFTPHIWLSLCILGFGIVMIGQGFVKNFGGLIATRFFLGLFEAGIFPGSFYLISFWYKRQGSLKRFTIYFCSVLLASAFGGLLASAIAKMDGIRGLGSWRWIFILEGIVTVFVAVAAFFFVSDFPSDAKWLSLTEREFVLRSTREHESSTGTKVTRRDLAEFFKDPKNTLGAIMYFSVVVPIYSFAYFTPTIVKTLGYSTVQTQLHSVPPFAAALGLCLVLAYLSDRSDIRLPYVLFPAALLIAGLAILMTTHGHFSAQYAGICLVCMGAFAGASLVICWYIMNLEGHKNRIIGSAWMISFGNSGGIIAPFAFLPKFAPDYRPGYSTCAGVAALGIVAALCYAACVVRERRSVRGNSAVEKTHVLSL
ncbi:Uu.00g142060.m01.CDS01 [Anthostomella pinea]|uniref:Uu.00g142060.m01.CDS01 n=1 Tax=Anthostomella pinea TaxID=933095 RepID=A0AAI8VQG5_9PEZI|nr:Uu.00g142060.m01.CDS01 [Anthostomella pinea]